MIRFLSFLLGKSYEPCKGCEILKQQLVLANEEKKALTETLLGLLKPKVYEATPIELQPSAPLATTFTRRRAAYEARDRETARTLKSSNLVARDEATTAKIEQLEEELGLTAESEKGA